MSCLYLYAEGSEADVANTLRRMASNSADPSKYLTEDGRLSPLLVKNLTAFKLSGSLDGIKDDLSAACRTKCFDMVVVDPFYAAASADADSANLVAMGRVLRDIQATMGKSIPVVAHHFKKYEEKKAGVNWTPAPDAASGVGFSEWAGVDIMLFSADGEFRDGPGLVKLRVSGRICKATQTDLAYSFNPETGEFPVDFITRQEAEESGLLNSVETSPVDAERVEALARDIKHLIDDIKAEGNAPTPTILAGGDSLEALLNARTKSGSPYIEVRGDLIHKVTKGRWPHNSTLLQIAENFIRGEEPVEDPSLFNMTGVEDPAEIITSVTG